MTETALQKPPATPGVVKKLWPQPLEIIGLTGEFASGKTLFGLTIDPTRTLIYDTEKSAGSYESLGFDRIDIPRAMSAVHPNGYKPIQTFEWWLASVRAIPRDKYTVIVLDTISEIETGLADWVRAHPGEFGRTMGQYIKMAGLMWGDVKEYWKAILSDLSARCQTFAFTSHMGNVWAGDRPSGKRKPKGKETLMELASLYLHMERKADSAGNMPAKPSAIVLKSRLATMIPDPETGDIRVVPTLPPRIPVATPHAIRQYMLHPPDYSKLKAEEQAPEKVMTEDERAEIRLASAEAERETEALRLEQLERKQKQQERAQQQPSTAATQIQNAPQSNGSAAPSDINAPPLHQRCGDSHKLQIKDLLAELKPYGMTVDHWKAAIQKYYGVATANHLTPAQADEMIGRLKERLYALRAANPATAAADAEGDLAAPEPNPETEKLGDYLAGVGPEAEARAKIDAENAAKAAQEGGVGPAVAPEAKS